MAGVISRGIKEAEKLLSPHTTRWICRIKSSDDCLGNPTTCFYSGTGIHEASGHVGDTGGNKIDCFLSFPHCCSQVENLLSVVENFRCLHFYSSPPPKTNPLLWKPSVLLGGWKH